MALLLTCATGFALSLACALVLVLKLPALPFVAGVSALSPERRANVDVPRLARHHAVVFSSLAAFFLACSLALALRLIPESIVISASLFALCVSYDFFWTGFRASDRNEYSRSARIASRVSFIAVNALFLSCVVVFAP